MKIEHLVNDRGNNAVNQFVITTEKGIYFQSYESMICKYLNGILFVTPLWDYSNTTRKHFYIFLRRYTHFGRLTKQDVLNYLNNTNEMIKVEESALELVTI